MSKDMKCEWVDIRRENVNELSFRFCHWILLQGLETTQVPVQNNYDSAVLIHNWNIWQKILLLVQKRLVLYFCGFELIYWPNSETVWAE